MCSIFDEDIHRGFYGEEKEKKKKYILITITLERFRTILKII